MSTVGLRDLLAALSARARPSYGAEEERVWQTHRAQVIARALGLPIDDDVPPELRDTWQQLLRCLEPRARHPFAGALEAGLLESRYEAALAPVHEAFDALSKIHQAEAARLLSVLYGEVDDVDAARLADAGLDPNLAPNWDVIFDRL